MSELRPTIAGSGGRSRADLALEKLWMGGKMPSLSVLGRSFAQLDVAELLVVLRCDQHRRWTSGERVDVLDYLTCFPQVASDPEDLFELVYSEWLLREQLGETPLIEEYIELFPSLAERMHTQLEVHRSLNFDDGAFEHDANSVDEGLGGIPEDPFVYCSGLPLIPGYEVLSELGRGGMGVVYRAIQLTPRREVAIKMILAGVLASNQERIRFQNEAEIVASLDHPNIVPILELGHYGGLLYFTMKLISGGSLAECLERFRDDSPAIAALMLEIISAIRHAHERGLLHRDLKPANILIDEMGRPHVTDFGLAKRTLGESGLTRTGWFIGSPGYMAPEQASGQSSSITTATDIYGLGAILYSLLTGRPPFEGHSVQETIDKLRDRPPEAPSRINSRTPKALEVICLKCLEKNPARRYSSTDALADDLKRWRDGMPISARPVSPVERVWLWGRRSPTLAALTGALATAVLVGIIVSGSMWYRAEANLRIAKNAAKSEREAKIRAQSRFSVALNAIKDVYNHNSNNKLSVEPDLDGSRLKLLHQAGAYYKRLQASLADDPTPEAREQLAWAYLELGSVTLEYDKEKSCDEAEAAFATALSIFAELRQREPTVERDFVLAHFYLQRGVCERAHQLNNEAMLSLEQAKTRLQTLVSSPRVHERSLVDLSWCIGNIATIEMSRGHNTEALKLHKQVRDIRSALLVDHPESLSHKLDHGWALFDIAITHNSEKHLDLALSAARQASDELDACVRANPTHLDALNRCTLAMNYRAACEGNSNNFEDMIRASNRAIALGEDLARLSTEDPRKNESLANIYVDHASRLVSVNDLPTAKRERERAIKLYEQLLKAYPGTPRLQAVLARQSTMQAHLLLDMGDIRGSVVCFERALDLCQMILLAGPASDKKLAAVVHLQVILGITYLRLGEPSKAYEYLDITRSRISHMSTHYPEIHYDLACLLSLLSSARNDQSLADQAMLELSKSAAAGFRDAKFYQADADLKPLAKRRDFQDFLLDLAFPNDPFLR